jgi:hypothetical protein
MRTSEHAEVDEEIFGRTTVSFANSFSSGIWAYVWRRRMSLG